jgi:NAD(P)-dependent dehydrogenase (short-subunit alcohol dehydrogenase family)
MAEKKVALITGVSSGNGLAIVQLLAQRDFTVFGTSRNPEGIGKMPNVEVLPLDVTSEASVEALLNAVLKTAGRVDILINNAGFVLGGALEETQLEEAKTQFETNFFGAVRMIQAVLPIMRKQRSGHIINVSSVVGLAPLPFLGYYSASKFALEGYTEALRQEVKPFNIQVSMVEPGFIKTNISSNQQETRQRISEYDPWREPTLEAVRQYIKKAPEPTLVARSVLHVIESNSPRLRYKVGKDAALLLGLRRFLPESLYERVVRRHFHLDAKSPDLISTAPVAKP